MEQEKTAMLWNWSGKQIRINVVVEWTFFFWFVFFLFNMQSQLTYLKPKKADYVFTWNVDIATEGFFKCLIFPHIQWQKGRKWRKWGGGEQTTTTKLLSNIWSNLSDRLFSFCSFIRAMHEECRFHHWSSF